MSSSSERSASSEEEEEEEEAGGGGIVGAAVIGRIGEPSSSRMRSGNGVWPEPFVEALATQVAVDAATENGRLAAGPALSSVFQIRELRTELSLANSVAPLLRLTWHSICASLALESAMFLKLVLECEKSLLPGEFHFSGLSSSCLLPVMHFSRVIAVSRHGGLGNAR
ncbi:hypothetical protein ACLOJK_035700 [Asimina triloba]